MSVFGKRQSTIGPGHDGAPKPGFYAKPGKPGLSEHHGHTPARIQEAQQHDRATLGKPGKPKVFSTPVHYGMTDRQLAGVNVGGMGHGSAVVSGGEVVGTNAAAVPPVPAHRRGKFGNGPAVPHVPITSAYGGVPKVRTAAPVAWNNKSRTGPLARSLTDATPHDIRGKLLLDEAKS